MYRKYPLLTLLLFLSIQSIAQETFPINGVQDVHANYYSFIHARIVPDPENVIENGTMVIKDGIIEMLGTGINPPKGSVVIDLKGKSIYPSFIDPYTNYGIPEEKAKRKEGPQFISNKPGAYNWNEAIRPEYNAADNFVFDEKKSEELRKVGFGYVLSFSRDGIARGNSVLVSLAVKRENELIIRKDLMAHFSFSRGSSSQDYPSSLMGSIALLRQSLYDAIWYKGLKNPAEMNLSLEALGKQMNMPKIFEASDVYDIFRAQKIAEEFNTTFIYKSAGNDYQRLQELAKLNVDIIVPLNFPPAYDVEDRLEAMNISYSDLKRWELAPYNPAFLEDHNIRFSFTSSDLKNTSDFLKQVRVAVAKGLSEKVALKALTVHPAQLLKIADRAGTLHLGLDANFIITSGNIFEEDVEIYQNWIKGEPYIIKQAPGEDIRGNYRLVIGNIDNYQLIISGNIDKPDAELMGVEDSIRIKTYISRHASFINLIFELPETINKGKLRLSGTVSGDSLLNFKGEANRFDGSIIPWSAVRIKTFEENKKKKKEAEVENPPGKITYPFSAYGWTDAPKAERILFKHATVWTNEADGILEDTDVLTDGGKIIQISKNIPNHNAKIIDARGKHITPGIIDEHSHIAITRGVNEGTQSNSAEVRIGDVINPNDINIYRQLSGGVTTSQLLHGSANAIGGQSALIKLRWGKSPEEMKFENADGFIKFALGENVKQSNWGEQNRIRFPQTRMGVEQVYIDAFTRAKEYQQKLNRANKANVRRDLELDALVEILNGKRFITCHSYVQSEINMLMKVADSMGFKVNTFTHILEGYKVADKMKAHGAGASTFSDWWAYKYEVIDAIPYNGAIMHKAGLTTAFNSDDAEMARRLNQEAAKAMLYGNLSNEDALKLVTLNPAKLLHIDHRVGSIKSGKDADLVLWSDHPLSIYAKAEKTLVDGIIYYDSEKDAMLQKEIAAERERIIQKLLHEKKIGRPTQKNFSKEPELYHCEDLENIFDY